MADSITYVGNKKESESRHANIVKHEKLSRKSSDDDDFRRLKPPNQKAHVEDQDNISAQIQTLENKLKQTHLFSEDVYLSKIKSIRSEKDSAFKEKHIINSELKAITQEIAKQKVSLTKSQTDLPYKNEDLIHKAISRLEFQLGTKNYSLSEEKKIVAEIDSLRRSKKALSRYLEIKSEVDQMKVHQKKLRESMEHYFMLISNLKSQEDKLRNDYQKNRTNYDAIKKEIDSLVKKKQTQAAEFKKSERLFYEQRDDMRKKQKEALFQRREQERKAINDAYQLEMAEYEASREPYEDEKLLCNTLITYLRKFLPTSIDPQPLAQMAQDQVGLLSPSSSPHSSDSDPLKNSQDMDGLYLLRRDHQEEYSVGCKPKVSKRSKREKRKSWNKPIVHSPEIFSQFASLNIKAPNIISDIDATVDLLQQKLLLYERKKAALVSKSNTSSARSVPEGGANVTLTLIDSVTGSDATPSSSAESAFSSESVPSTPEVMHDTQNPLRLAAAARPPSASYSEPPTPAGAAPPPPDSGLCSPDATAFLSAPPDFSLSSTLTMDTAFAGGDRGFPLYVRTDKDMSRDLGVNPGVSKFPDESTMFASSPAYGDLLDSLSLDERSATDDFLANQVASGDPVYHSTNQDVSGDPIYQ